jgi:DNA-binding transcriptional LysR family regulator
MLKTTPPPESRNARQLQEAMEAHDLLRQPCIFGFPFTLTQLCTLKAIAAGGNFSRAADSLYVTQSTVSCQIQHLERDLNISLFDRGSGKKIEFTEAGQILLSYSEKILSLCQEASRTLDNLRNLQSSTLILGASQNAGAYLMPCLISLFHPKYPQILVQLQVHSTSRTCWNVANGQVDIAIVEGSIPSEFRETLEIIVFTTDELALILPVSHPLAQRKTIQPEDLYTLPFITLDSQSSNGQVIDQMLVQGDIQVQRLNVAMELSSIEAIKNAVQAGLGAAFVPTSALEKELKLGLLYQAQIKNVTIQQEVSVIFKRNHTLSKAAEIFRSEVLPQFATLETRAAPLNAHIAA